MVTLHELKLLARKELLRCLGRFLQFVSQTQISLRCVARFKDGHLGSVVNRAIYPLLRPRHSPVARRREDGDAAGKGSPRPLAHPVGRFSVCRFSGHDGVCLLGHSGSEYDRLSFDCHAKGVDPFDENVEGEKRHQREWQTGQVTVGRVVSDRHLRVGSVALLD